MKVLSEDYIRDLAEFHDVICQKLLCNWFCASTDFGFCFIFEPTKNVISNV